MRHAEILHRCFRCGYCKLPSDYQDLNCPSYLRNRFETFSPGGRMWLLRAWLDGEIKTSPRLGRILYSCATCNNCVEHCPFPKFKDDLVDAFIAGREALVDQGQVPSGVRDYFKAVQISGNPYKKPQPERGDWARDLGPAGYSGQEYLLYVGCVGSYDERGQQTARAVAGLLKDLGVDFGILGAEEHCDGNEVRALGETGLFALLARQNIEQWQKLGVSKIITFDPHAYNAIKNEYPARGGQFEVFHYAQILPGLLRQAAPQARDETLSVTFHDPCSLGRHNQEYDAPRRALQALPGVKLVEMELIKKDALCCG
ncbi:MAG: (Fe-S)-binding protein, partial [Proteobacteria bacterium]|nr:(Fe-S)-binding protein [Pseudomonadota bacterium]